MSSVHTYQSHRQTGSVSIKPPNAPLFRRLLLPHLPATTPPPPLLVSASAELNAELYDFLALALRAYITPWWSKITRYDREFLPHVTTVLAEVIRSLEVRVASADVSQLLLGTIPTLVAQHYADYRAVTAKLGTSYASGGGVPLAQLFHQTQSHTAVNAEGQIDATYFRHALDHVLNTCLPSEDNESEAERSIIREVIVKVLVVDVAPLLVQPWFIHSQLLNLLYPTATSRPSVAQDESVTPSGGLSFHSMVVFFLSAVQYLSGLSLTLINLYKRTVHTVKLVNKSPLPPTADDPPDYTACLLLVLSEILTLSGRSTSSALLVVARVITGFLGAFLDRCITYTLLATAFTERNAFIAIQAAKSTMFPDGYPGPPTIIPTPEEQVAIKEELVSHIGDAVPSWVSAIILGDPPTNRHSILGALEPLSSPACNTHLLVLLFDALVLALFPELGTEVPPVPTMSQSTSVSTGADGDGSLLSPRESTDEGNDGSISPLSAPGSARPR